MEKNASVVRLFQNITFGLPDGFQLLNTPDLDGEDIVKAIELNPSIKVIPNREGKIAKVENKGNVQDYGKNGLAFPFHNDGPYFHRVPKWVILYCRKAGNGGGQTFFSNTNKVIAELRERFDSNLLQSMNIVYMHRDRTKFRFPLVQKDEQGGEHLNWNTSLYLEPDLQVILESNRQSFTQRANELMSTINLLLEKNMVLEHDWNDGDLLLFDNHLLLHGRRVVPAGSERLLYRIWIDLITFDSSKKRVE